MTGGAGFIGSHVVEALVAQGKAVVVLDNLCSGREENLAAVWGDIDFVEGDVAQLSELRERIGNVDSVIHLAALISSQDSLHAPDEYLNVNLHGLQRVIDFVASIGARRLIFASSSTVYGNRPGVALAEDLLPEPLTTYALTKLAGEHLIGLYAMLHGFSHCSLRLFNVYGPRQATDHAYANVTCKFSHAAAHGLPVTLVGDGEQRRDFVYVTDVVEAFLAVLEQAPRSLYNVGRGETCSINALLTHLEAISGKPIAVQPSAPWPNDIRSILADTSRIGEDLDFHPKVELRDGLAQTVEWFRTHAR